MLSGRMADPSSSTSIRSYSPASRPDSSTFRIHPSLLPTNASVCGPMLVTAIEVSETPSPNANRADAITGVTPLIFSPTWQKLKMLPSEPATGHLPSLIVPEM